jgi:eukaryotic-like serine/threonine-protein kinase
MSHDESSRSDGDTHLTAKRASLPSNVVSSEDDPVENEHDDDIADMVCLLEKVWPRHDHDREPTPERFGRFSIIGELGRGGFGVVYLAEDPLLNRRVALKLPQVGVVSGNESWRRFVREAKAASRLEHPNLIPLLEAGTIGPIGYMASVYVAGPSLEQWLRYQKSPTSPRWGARVVAVLARAMEHAHERGILHRDLKPANILLHARECDDLPAGNRAWEGGKVESWVPRICDFGMAKLREAEGDETRSRIACGSPSYMAPEQAEARKSEIAAQTDVYGLGAILYQILTGRPPFSGKSDLEILRRVVTEEPAALHKLRPGLPRDLETICLKCLAKKPGERYSASAALAEDLERFLDGRPILARPVAVWERGWRWARRRPALAALSSVLMIAVAGLGALFWYDSRLGVVNENLRLAVAKAHTSTEELGQLKSRAEKYEQSVSRQIAAREIRAAQHAMVAGDYKSAVRLLKAAESEFGSSAKTEFARSLLEQLVPNWFAVFESPGAQVRRIAVSADGRTIASGDEKRAIHLWDRRTGRHRALVAEKFTVVQYLAFSLDGRELAAATSGAEELSLWEVATGRLRGRLPLSAHRAASAVLFSRDGKRLAAVGRQPGVGFRSLEYWDVGTASATLSIVAPEHDPAMIADMTDNRLRSLADIMDNRAPSWSGSLANLRRSWVEHRPRGIERTKDDEMGLIASGDGTFEVFWLAKRLRTAIGCIHTHGCALVFFDHHDPIWSLGPAERASRERLAETLVPHSMGKLLSPNVIVRLGTWDRTAAFSPDGSRLAVWNENNDNRLKIIDLTTGLVCSTFDFEPLYDMLALTFTPDSNTLIFGGADGKIRQWHFRSSANSVVLPGHSPKESWSLAFSPNGETLASAGDDHCIRIWKVGTGEEIAVLRGHNALVTSVAFAPDGRTLASASLDIERSVVLWDTSTWTLRSVLRGHTAYARSVSFSPDSRTLASGADDNSVILYDVLRARRKRTIWPDGHDVARAALSPDGRLLGSSDANTVVLTDLIGGASRSIDTGDTQILSIAFSPDGSHLTTGHAGGLIKAWDVATGRQVREYAGHTGIVFGLAFSPDGRTLASAGEDRTVRVWDTSNDEMLLCLTDCTERVNAIAFSPDGDILAAADHTGAITLWHAAPRPAPLEIAGSHTEKVGNPGG